MKFRRPFESYDSKPTCAGEKERVVYTLVNKNGERSLKVVDKIDIVEQINSYRDQTDIKAMLRRFSMTGDASVLRKGVNGIYGDFTSCETNYAKLLDSSRQLALLELQGAFDGTEMSKDGKEEEAAVTGSSSAASDVNSNNGNTEVV